MERKFFTITNAEGVPVAFYTSSLHSGNIPNEAFEISQEQYQECLAHQGERAFIDGALVEYRGRPDPEAVRLARNEKLRESDWTQLPDSPLSDSERAEWASCRQALRDLDMNGLEISWPKEPEKA